MVQLGKILRWFFALNAAVFAVIGARSVALIPLLAAHGSRNSAMLILEAAGDLVMAAAFANAFWKLRRGGTEARWWALAASALAIVCYWLLEGAPLWLAAGIVGLAVFGRRETVEAMSATRTKALRLRGDGTSGSVDGAANFATIAGCIAACYFWAAWASRNHLPNDDKVILWVLYIEIATLVTTLGHETGHALAAAMLGMKLRRFIVGPVAGAFRGGKWKIEFKVAGLLGAPGSVGVVPTGISNLRNRHVLVAAAGPLASLLLGSVAAFGALTAKGQPWEPAWRLLAFTATFSLLSFVFNLVPAKPESIYSDGARIYQLLSRGPWADVHLALSMASCTLASSTRPRDMDIEVIERARAFLTIGIEALLLRVQAKAFWHDSGWIPEAIRALEDAEHVYEASIPELRADLHKSFVFDNAILKRDAAAARTWWNRMEAKKGATIDADYWLSLGALLWVEGRIAEAESALETCEALLTSNAATGAVAYQRDCFEQLRQAVNTGAADISTPATMVI